MELRIDGTEVRVRRPRANKSGRRAFVSGKMKQNTKKATVISDDMGRTLWTGAFRPGRMHDQTALKTEGICSLFEQYPQVKAKVDAGYRGLAKQFPDQVAAPPLKPKRDAPPEEAAALGEGAQEAVLRANLCRARQRRAQAVATPPALHRAPRVLRRDPPGDRRTGLRPRSPAVITHRPHSQVTRPRPQSRTTSLARQGMSVKQIDTAARRPLHLFH
ncbi:transposase family protein [Streptomyces werraensis]|uniref:transposase family protein n=1 Tax=Streptomyces werraensis TaxID=68284 RepID=UPI0038246595